MVGCPGAQLGDGAIAGDWGAEGEIVAEVEYEGGLVNSRPRETAGGAAVADL